MDDLKSKKTSTGKGTLLIVMRIAELAEPYVPSVEGECGNCGQDVWVEKRMAKQSGLTIVCLRCMEKNLPRYMEESTSE